MDSDSSVIDAFSQLGLSLDYEMQRTGIQLAPALVTAVQQLNKTFAAPYADE